jgi:hypothetical protein
VHRRGRFLVKARRAYEISPGDLDTTVDDFVKRLKEQEPMSGEAVPLGDSELESEIGLREPLVNPSYFE